METTVAKYKGRRLRRYGRSNIRDNRFNNHSYLEEADMSS